VNASTESGHRRRSEFAIASLTMGILTFINLLGVERAVPAIVFGVLALRRMRADDQVKGKGHAIAGVVLGVLGVMVLPTLGLILLPKIFPIFRGPGAATVSLADHPDPAGAVTQIRKSVQAFESMQAWLHLVDAGQYADAWEASARANKDAVTKDSVVKMYNGFRTQLGDVASRQLKSANYTASLPGAPPGEYVVIEFNTTFDNNRRFVERITPMLDTDGQWKVSGYYLLR
jgi:hypothetical protein